jgi:hypothetical protein
MALDVAQLGWKIAGEMYDHVAGRSPAPHPTKAEAGGRRRLLWSSRGLSRLSRPYSSALRKPGIDDPETSADREAAVRTKKGPPPRGGGPRRYCGLGYDCRRSGWYPCR